MFFFAKGNNRADERSYKRKTEEYLYDFLYIATPTKEAVADIDHEDESNDWPGSVHNIKYSTRDGKLITSCVVR